MTAHAERRLQDIEKLHVLSKNTGGKISVANVKGSPPREIELKFRLNTVPSSAFPGRTQQETTCFISLPNRYPFVEPTATLRPVVFHPNVYASGLICLGVKWMPTLGLDQLAKRIGQILVFDPDILNEDSPANGDALNWYRTTLTRQPNLFPTDSLRPSVSGDSKTAVQWKDLNG